MKNNYQVLDRIILSDYTKLRDLYKKIVSLKKDPYEDLERIVFVYNPKFNKILRVVEELLTFVDIPSYFVIFEQDETLVEPNLDFIPTDTHCIYPWINFVILNDGEVRPCCKYSSSIASDAKIQHQQLVNIYTSDYMKTLREKFRQGQKPQGCSACWHEESIGLTSMRQAAKFKFNEIWYTVDYTLDDVSNLQLLDLKLGNECNLSCRICNPESSSKIADFDLLHNRISKDRYIRISDSSKWGEENEFYDQLIKVSSHLRYLDIFGGEPLMIKRHFDFLRELIKLGVAKDIKIDYNSNGTIYSEMFFELWEHFKQVKISFSIDDIGQRFELQRNGASWVKVQENIKKFAAKKSNKFLIDVYVTVNIMNIYYLPELIAWIEQQDFSHPPTFSFLYDPTYLSVNTLTNQAKDIILDKFNQYKDQPLLRPFITKLEQLTLNDTNLEFVNFTKQLDHLRGQDFISTHTNIAKAMGCR